MPGVGSGFAASSPDIQSGHSDSCFFWVPYLAHFLYSFIAHSNFLGDVMAPNTWATADQIVWLKERQPAYLEAQSKKQLRSMTRFWNKLEHNWFEAFPEEKAKIM
ncbi:hypothetical protein B0H10DRAFT_1945721 [Mycena sp. CBHHK59/15]|nr:hypothetical protein B0H10DRAFT_1945721 [Mycena sp. CBHHK59/15]